MSLEQALKDIKKKFGPESILKGSEAKGLTIKRLSTGSLSMDTETGGGWAQGKINEIFGPYSSGKTFIALHTVAANQREYPEANFAWIDAEGAFDPVWSEKIGVDLDRLLVITPLYMEDALDMATALIRSQDLLLLVIDSWAAMCPKSEAEGDMEDSTVGLRARLGNKFIRKSIGRDASLSEEFDLGKTTLLIINQTYAGIGQYAAEETPGGVQLKYLSMIRIRIRRTAVVQEKTGELIRQESTFVVKKNKTFPPERIGSFWFSLRDNEKGPAGSIWRVGEIVDYGVVVGVIKKAGSWYLLPEKYSTEKFHGSDAVCDWLEEQDENIIKEIKELILSESRSV